MKAATLVLVLMTAACGAWAQATPAGLWKTIDDKTKTERALVRISETGGVFSGRVEKVLAADVEPGARCDKCEDDRKDQPMLGMEILRAVKRGAADNLWDGGTILDAREGKVYKVRLQTTEGGRKLDVRGYIGMPMLGRTQTWLRVE